MYLTDKVSAGFMTVCWGAINQSSCKQWIRSPEHLHPHKRAIYQRHGIPEPGVTSAMCSLAHRNTNPYPVHIHCQYEPSHNIMGKWFYSDKQQLLFLGFCGSLTKWGYWNKGQYVWHKNSTCHPEKTLGTANSF